MAVGLYSDLEVSLSFLPLGLCHVTFEGVDAALAGDAELGADAALAGGVELGVDVAGDVGPGGVCVSEDSVT